MAFVTPIHRVIFFGDSSTRLKVSRHRNRSIRKRQKPVATVSLPDEPPHAPNIDYDEFVSDDTHVVLDSSQIGAVLEKLKENGRDSALDLDWEEEFLALAEEEVDEQSEETKSDDAQSDDAQSDDDQLEETESEEAQFKDKAIEAIEGETNDQVLGKSTMDYFAEENASYMPRWLREMYENGSYEELEKGAEQYCNKQRLHDIVARKKDLKPENVATGDGIVDCTVGDVADDYSVPVEFVVDAMLAYGVPVPITQSTSVRNSMTTEEIKQLLKLITSFDAVDLAERYSDDSLAELAEAYEVDVSRFVDVCEKEGLYLFRGEQTRLSLVRENRVLDILFKGADMGQPYPPLLQGLD